jgi:hypothetical protein
MTSIDAFTALFVVAAFLFQIVLVVHFAVRRWAFDTAIRFGPIVYFLSIPAALLNGVMLVAGEPCYLWMAGFLYLIWAGFGYCVEYVLHFEWRSPIHWPVFVTYLRLYLATVMFYGWPLAHINWQLWAANGALFVIGTILNVSSHHGPDATRPRNA